MGTYDKLAIINDCLVGLGENPVNEADDGSQEWQVCSSAYDSGVPLLLERRNWKFTTTIAALVRSAASTFPGYTDAYAIPPDCLHVLNVWRTDEAALVYPEFSFGQPREAPRAPGMNYRIIGGLVQCAAPNGATCLYVQQSQQQQPWPESFAQTLRMMICAAICYGLREDMAAGQIFDRKTDQELQLAAERDASQEPRRALMRSGRVEARRRPRYGGWIR